MEEIIIDENKEIVFSQKSKIKKKKFIIEKGTFLRVVFTKEYYCTGSSFYHLFYLKENAKLEIINLINNTQRLTFEEEIKMDKGSFAFVLSRIVNEERIFYTTRIYPSAFSYGEVIYEIFPLSSFSLSPSFSFFPSSFHGSHKIRKIEIKEYLPYFLSRGINETEARKIIKEEMVGRCCIHASFESREIKCRSE